jgi:hypothetical protein
VTYSPPRNWHRPPPLYPWQRVILRLVIAAPGATAQEIGDRYYPRGSPYLRGQVATHELRILERACLVQRHRHSWSPALMASEVLRRAERQPAARAPSFVAGVRA